MNGTSGQNMTMNSTMIGNYTLKDIISYHITQQAVPLNSSINSTIVAGTIATNQTIDKFPQGGLPLIIMNNSTQNATNSSSSGSNVVMNIRLPILNILQPGPTNSSSGNSSSGNGSGSSGSGSANFTVGNGVDNALVTNQSNIMASNGIIHVIDSVLLPPGQLTQVLQNISIAQPIKDMLNQYSQYSTQINQERNVTIFVPNQAGYCASCISSQSQNQLEDLVKSHIVRGIYFSSNFTMGQTTNLTTLDSTQIPVTYNSSGITVNNTISVVQPDILFNGGVIHIINGQLNATASNRTSSADDMEGDD
ncbi:FAS1 domain-containing protein [Gongronella butleri]|nr:FAS1 domain-containing protein [Gongronella butleri]